MMKRKHQKKKREKFQGKQKSVAFNNCKSESSNDFALS